MCSSFVVIKLPNGMFHMQGISSRPIIKGIRTRGIHRAYTRKYRVKLEKKKKKGKKNVLYTVPLGCRSLINRVNNDSNGTEDRTGT
jgi:hypothetical protein